MARFFFNLLSPGTCDRDEIGCEFDCVETAYIEAHRAAVAIIADMLRARVNPGKYQFEITDEQGRFLIDLPFSEVLTPGAAPVMHSTLQDNVRRQMSRARQLRNDIRDELDNVRTALEGSRAALARSRSR